MKHIYLLISLFIITACQMEKDVNSNPTKPVTLEKSKMGQDKTFTITGTMLYKNLEGGFFAFDSDDGKKYVLSGLEKNMLKHGLRLKITATQQPDVLTIQQYGTPLKVLSATIIGQAKIKDQNL